MNAFLFALAFCFNWHLFCSFELFGGNIHGKFEELIPNKKIVQSWRYNQWPSGHYSNVVIEFDDKVRNLIYLYVEQLYD